MGIDTIIIWHLFSISLCSNKSSWEPQVPASLTHQPNGIYKYPRVNQKQMQASGFQDKLHLCHYVSLSALPHLREALVETKL